MSIPTGASQVHYNLGGINTDESVWNVVLSFPISGGPVWSAQELNDRVEAMMDSYLEDSNLTYPPSAGWTNTGSRVYDCSNVQGDTWPTP